MTLEKYYAGYNERDRLNRHWLEWEVSFRTILQHLPNRSCKILDVGGGPGRYAVELAKMGHQVSLVDIVPIFIEQAAESAGNQGVKLKCCEVADARDLSLFSSETFDAVLLMGPLYHLTEESDRRIVLNESRRVLTKGGTIFAAWLTRYASLRNVLSKNPEVLANPTDAAIERKLLKTGCFVAEAENGAQCPWYFEYPAKAVSFTELCGFKRLDVVGVEGIAAEYDRHWNDVSSAARKELIELAMILGREETGLSCSNHVLFVGTK